jgi:hypothetical protein
VVGNLNTFYGADGVPDPIVEEFLSTYVDGRVAPILYRIAAKNFVVKSADARRDPRRLAAKNEKAVRGGNAPITQWHYIEFSAEEMRLLATYIASLIVRVPGYRNHLGEKLEAVVNSVRLSRNQALMQSFPSDHNGRLE